MTGHGTRGRYDAGCRCPACREAARRAKAEWRYRRDHGQPAMTPSAPVLAHIDALHAAGMTYQAIASAAMPQWANPIPSLRGLYASDRIRAATATAFLAVSLDTTSNGVVSAVPAMWRLRALHRMAWSSHTVASAIGVTRETIAATAAARRPHIRRATHTAVRDLFNRWWDQPGGSPVTAARAAARGWPMPLDLEDTGMPATGPDGCATCWDIRFLRTQGLTDAAIAARLGWVDTTHPRRHLTRHHAA